MRAEITAHGRFQRSPSTEEVEEDVAVVEVEVVIVGEVEGTHVAEVAEVIAPIKTPLQILMFSAALEEQLVLPFGFITRRSTTT